MSQPNGTDEKTLADWRQEIDTLDTELLRLLNRRAAIAGEIALIKVAMGLPAYDAKREEQVLERVAAKNNGPFDHESVRAIFRAIIHETRRLGTERMQGFSETPKRSEGALRAQGIAHEPICSGKRDSIE
ncbi:MAG TPA: chorismate mutase [Candidatus Angelobacter sp.]|nr:chorismate mutase [Candidatus Angelobacter sp.]